MRPIHSLPPGYADIPDATFKGELVHRFGFKRTRMTNGEWGAPVQSLGHDRYLLLSHHFGTGVTEFRQNASHPDRFLKARAALKKQTVDWDAGEVVILPPANIMMESAFIVLKMVDNLSLRLDEEGRIFSREKQPVMASYFHFKALCLLMTRQSPEGFRYDLPTDSQLESVAGQEGLFRPDGSKRFYIEEYEDGRGKTVDVDDPRSSPGGLGVQIYGNVPTWTRYNPKFKEPNEPFLGPYAWRGGFWFDIEQGVSRRYAHHPGTYRLMSIPYTAGCSPVTVLS